MPAGDDSLTRMGAAQLAALMRARQVSPTEVIDASLARVEMVNTRLNAIVTLRAEEARAEAREAERMLMAGAGGPLCGVPITIKDALSTRGVRTTSGSRLYASHVPRTDATVVARLKAAGAIVLGKTNTPEFAADLQTDNLLFGSTRNPWDTERTPGGSSGGDAAAVASGCVALGIGTDFGGSLRWPAHCTGLATIRPTAGRVPATGFLPSLSPLDPPPPNSLAFAGQLHVLGPLARSVEDVELALRVISGPDGVDGLTVPAPLDDSTTVNERALRIAWCEGEGSQPVRSDLVAAVKDVARRLQRDGHQVVHASPAGFEQAESLYARMRGMDGLADVRELVAGREAELSPNILLWLERSRERSVGELLRANLERDALKARLVAFLEEHQVLLMPVAALPAFPVGQRAFQVDGQDLPYFQLIANCRAISLFGVPSAVVPCGRSREGLPVGVQIVAAPFREHVALAVARAIEQAFGGYEPPPAAI